VDRAISSNEAEVVTWLLRNAAACDVAAYRLPPVEKLRVVGGCECGCASLDFEPKGQVGSGHMLADGVAVYPDGQKAGLILWGREGQIVWLEIYETVPGSSRRFPEISQLYTWEQLGQRGL